jgi:hypothetical protein
MIIILRMWFGLIPMNKSPLDLSLLWNHIPPSFSSLSYRNQQFLFLLIISMYKISICPPTISINMGSLSQSYRLTSLIHMYKITLQFVGIKTRDVIVIKIMGEYDPYPTLLGIDWAFENNVVLNLKKWQMLFEANTLHVITSLDPNEGGGYKELVDEDVQISIIEISTRS